MAVIVALNDLPAVIALALGYPVVNIAVVGHAAGREGTVAVLCPECIWDTVGVLVTHGAFLGHECVKL